MGEESMTKEKLKTILFIVLLVVYNLAALSGAVVAGIYQYQLHIEKFGMFVGNAHIYNVHDWWLLTMLLFIPEALLFGVKIK